jgi:class 3 adenylate cyclase
MPSRVPKNLRNPDESVRLPGVEEDLVYVGEEVVARVVQYPGWRWSNDMRAIAGGQWCESHHVGVTLSGRQGVVLRDGTVLEFGPDDVYDIPPGHDGYTIGDEPAVMIEWSGARTWAGRDRRFLDRALATLLVVDIVESTSIVARIGDGAWRELLGRHVEQSRAKLAQFRGTEVDRAGDGLLASFDGPARAIRCALAMRQAARAEGLDVRAAVHVGEVEVVGEQIRGLAVHEAARIAAAANPGEILVSQTTRDLSAGAGLLFEDRGLHPLKGIPEPRRLFALSEGPVDGLDDGDQVAPRPGSQA